MTQGEFVRVFSIVIAVAIAYGISTPFLLRVLMTLKWPGVKRIVRVLWNEPDRQR